MDCDFVVDQKVIAVAKKWHIVFGDGPLVIKAGNIYTVRGIGIRYEIDRVCITVKEHGPNDWFTASGFRPLQDRPKEADTDISIFSPLLKTPEKVPELEPVP